MVKVMCYGCKSADVPFIHSSYRKLDIIIFAKAGPKTSFPQLHSEVELGPYLKWYHFSAGRTL